MPRSNSELAISMGKRMAARRKELGFTQEAIADIAGVTYQQYNKAENGKTCMNSDSLHRVVKALDISADFLLSGRTYAARYQEVMEILDQMSDIQLEMVRHVLQCMIQFGKCGTARDE